MRAEYRGAADTVVRTENHHGQVMIAMVAPIEELLKEHTAEENCPSLREMGR